MRVIVLGAGVVGMATAYYLWRDGHEVTVLERHEGPAREASFGNAGGLCPSFAGPWAAPGMVGKALRLSLTPGSPIRFRPQPDKHQWSWVAQWAANCTPERFRVNKLRMQRVAHYSLACLRSLVEESGLEGFDFHSDGVLQVFRTPAELDHGRLSARALEELGIEWRLLDASEVDALAPGLAQRSAAIEGALYLPADASGDSHRFSLALHAYLQARGVRFEFGTPVRALQHAAGKITGVQTAARQWEADAYVVALGSFAPRLLRPLGYRLPVYPLKGYSITVPVIDGGPTLQTALMDEHNKVMISRLGDRVRAAGMGELGGYDTRPDPSQRDMLIRVVREFFPQGLDFDRVESWAGLRPMTPDGPPVLGGTQWPNLFLNSGHGSNGWTQACGTSRIVADIVAGRAPAIDMDGLTGERFGMATA